MEWKLEESWFNVTYPVLIVLQIILYNAVTLPIASALKFLSTEHNLFCMRNWKRKRKSRLKIRKFYLYFI